MLRARLPGPYEDRVGPVVLTALLIVSILVNMSMKMIDIFDAKRTYVVDMSIFHTWRNLYGPWSPSYAHWINSPPTHTHTQYRDRQGANRGAVHEGRN